MNCIRPASSSEPPQLQPYLAFFKIYLTKKTFALIILFRISTPINNKEIFPIPISYADISPVILKS